MFESEMPAKREFHILPTPETVVRLVFRSVYLLGAALLLYFGGMYALKHSGVWDWWHPSEVAEEAEAATPPVRSERHAHAAVSNLIDRVEQPARTEKEPPRRADLAPQIRIKKPPVDEAYRYHHERGFAGTGCQPWVAWCHSAPYDDRELSREWAERIDRWRHRDQ